MTQVGARTRAWQRGAVLGLLGISLTAGVVGNALTPVLLRESPVALLVAHASYPQMALASARLDPVVLIGVAALRRWLGEAVYFAAGRVLGTDVLQWYANRRGKPLRLPHGLNHRFWVVRDAVVVFLPHPVVSAFFGAVGMPWLRYMILKLIGSIVTVAVFWYLSGFVQLPLAVAADFVEANAVAITIIAIVGGIAWWQWQRRGGGRAEESVQSP